MRTFYKQLDAKSLVIGILICIIAFLVFDGQKSRAQTRLPRNNPKYQMAVQDNDVYVLDTETGVVTRSTHRIAPKPPKYQIIAGDGGVYILNETNGLVRYRGKEAFVVPCKSVDCW